MMASTEKASGPIRTSKLPGHRVNKLVPPRPFPTVPPGVSATGPRSAHHEGKNYITITRKTKMGPYLRRCKDVVLKDGCVTHTRVARFQDTDVVTSYKSLHLTALGAAIPHLCTLVTSLPEVLPFPAGDIRTEVLTGTVDVQDELLPDDEDEDITYRTRAKSSLSVVIIIGDGVDESIAGGSKWGSRGKRRKRPTLVLSKPEEVGEEPGASEGDTE
jgi:ribonuclease P/MRP protein subunit RPP20